MYRTVRYLNRSHVNPLYRPVFPHSIKTTVKKIPSYKPPTTTSSVHHHSIRYSSTKSPRSISSIGFPRSTRRTRLPGRHSRNLSSCLRVFSYASVGVNASVLIGSTEMWVYLSVPPVCKSNPQLVYAHSRPRVSFCKFNTRYLGSVTRRFLTCFVKYRIFP